MILYSILIFVAGYMLVRSDIRFISFAAVLLIVMGGVCLQRLFDSKFFEERFRSLALLICYIGSFAFFPSLELLNNADYGRWHCDVKNSIMENFQQPGARIASNLYWHDTLYVVDKLDCRYLGKTKSPVVNKSLVDELNQFDVDYFLLWSSDENIVIPGYTLMDEENKYDLKVYKKE